MGRWTLLACCYVATNGDTKRLHKTVPVLSACATSMRSRADARTGLMAYDSSRCCEGQEITTYDSLDASLGQARANAYLGAKCWAAWLGLEMLGTMGDGDEQVEAQSLAPALES